MPLADDIQDLHDKTLAALDASHDYYTYSKRVWRQMQRAVARGHHFVFHNRSTKTSANEVVLYGRAQSYINDYLIPLTFQHFVALFEEFYFDLVRCWLASFPVSLAQKQVELRVVLNSANIPAIVSSVIERELNDLKYKRLSDWFSYLDKLVALGCPASDEVDSLAEIKASRDVFVHNKGVANAIYVVKSGKRARFAAGEKLELPEDYHRESWELIRKVVDDMASAAIKKA